MKRLVHQSPCTFEPELRKTTRSCAIFLQLPIQIADRFNFVILDWYGRTMRVGESPLFYCTRVWACTVVWKITD